MSIWGQFNAQNVLHITQNKCQLFEYKLLLWVLTVCYKLISQKISKSQNSNTVTRPQEMRESKHKKPKIKSWFLLDIGSATAESAVQSNLTYDR